MRKVIISFVVIMVLIGTGWYFLWYDKSVLGVLPEGVTSSQDCLQDGESVEYEIKNNRSKRKESYLQIRVLDKSGNLKNMFSEPITQPGHYHPYESRACATYFSQSLNYDYKNRKTLQGYRADIVAVNYGGEKTIIVNHAESKTGSTNDFQSQYSSDFRVSPNEKYLLLIQGFAGSTDKPYAVVIKDIKTLEDKLVVTFDEILQKNDMAAGDFRPLEWDDDRYLWIRLFETAYTNGWMRINISDWTYELFAAPEGVLGGYPLNTVNGWVPLIPGAFWTGVDEFNKEIEAERAAAGERVQLYLYNVITKDMRLIDTSDYSTWQNLGAVWVDDQTLEYNSPNGERKQYTASDF